VAELEGAPASIIGDAVASDENARHEVVSALDFLLAGSKGYAGV
jgi:hypothetical protein